jgi:3-methyladenine DNA glycosylase AlkD
LIDVTCPHIIGTHLIDKNREILYDFAYSDSLWKKRISIISTFAFIKLNQFEDSLKIADILLCDKNDLIHKAVGWTIRNIGNKNIDIMIGFLNSRYKTMPRVMLRYSIEKLDESMRQKYLKGLI